MKTTKLTIQNAVGLHARPAAMFVKTAQKFESEITVSYKENNANAKSILSVLSLAVTKGGKIDLSVDGPDEEEAFISLVDLVNGNFGE